MFIPCHAAESILEFRNEQRIGVAEALAGLHTWISWGVRLKDEAFTEPLSRGLGFRGLGFRVVQAGRFKRVWAEQ